MLGWKSTSQRALQLVHRIPSAVRTYAISLDAPQRFPGKKYPRVFAGKKADLYNWYSNLLHTHKDSAILFLQHEDFTADRLRKLRLDVMTAAQRSAPAPADPIPGTSSLLPMLTVVRTNIFGVALRDRPGINKSAVKKMVKGTKGSFALLTMSNFHPPQLKAILIAMAKSAPPKKPKTQEEIEQEQAAKNADPTQPGRRMKRVRPIRTPDLKVVGALIEDRVYIKEDVADVSKLPTLDTLRSQIVGLLGSSASQLAAVLVQASGGSLARTLEGFKKGLEEEQGKQSS